MKKQLLDLSDKMIRKNLFKSIRYNITYNTKNINTFVLKYTTY